jgi:uncharacterized protein YbcI
LPSQYFANKMDPRSLAASVIVVGRAGDRLLKLILRTRRYLKASDEIDTLIQELQRLKMVIEAVESASSALLPKQASSIQVIFFDCNKIIQEMEGILSACRKGLINLDGVICIHRLRLRWARQRSRTKDLKQQLRDAMSSLLLFTTISTP